MFGGVSIHPEFADSAIHINVDGLLTEGQQERRDGLGSQNVSRECLQGSEMYEELEGWAGFREVKQSIPGG